MADHAVAMQGTDRVRAGIRRVINHYKQHFTEADQGERYKWEAIGWYKKHWDINASDFAAMLEVAFSKTANLLASGMYYPYRMIVAYAQADPEEVRRIFKQLHDEELPLAQRYSAFRENCQRYIDKCTPFQLKTNDTICLMNPVGSSSCARILSLQEKQTA